MKYRIKEVRNKVSHSVYYPQKSFIGIIWRNFNIPIKYGTIGEAKATISSYITKREQYKQSKIIIHKYEVDK